MEEDYPGGWFGESWGAPVCDPSGHKPTPLGEPCMYCKAPIIETDQGLIVPGYYSPGEMRLDPIHIDCFRDRAGL